MKKTLLAALLILLAGCEYEVPLSQAPSTPANTALAGTWIATDTHGKTSITMDVKTTGIDYSVIYTEDGQTNYFSGFEVSTANLNLVQLKLLNVDEKNPEKQYVFLKYELTTNRLLIYMINPDVVSVKCQTTDELKGDIAVHRQNPFLFNEPLIFTKLVPQ